VRIKFVLLDSLGQRKIKFTVLFCFRLSSDESSNFGEVLILAQLFY
jgi:hypothetical protein